MIKLSKKCLLFFKSWSTVKKKELHIVLEAPLFLKQKTIIYLVKSLYIELQHLSNQTIFLLLQK